MTKSEEERFLEFLSTNTDKGIKEAAGWAVVNTSIPFTRAERLIHDWADEGELVIVEKPNSDGAPRRIATKLPEEEVLADA